MLGSASSQMRYRQQVEDYLSKKVETMLASVIGPGNAVVRVSAEIDTEATTQTSEKYDPDGQVVRSQTQTEDSTNTSEARSGGGATGISANVPDKGTPAAEAARPTSVSEQSRKNRTTTYEINRVTTNTTRNPGTVKNVSAAVFIAPKLAPAAPAATGADANAAPAAPQYQKRTPQELEALRQIVINALGLKPAPGQSPDSVVSLQEMEFQAVEQTAAQLEAVKSSQPAWQTYVELASRWVAVGGALIVFLIFWRMLKRQKPEPVPIEVLSLSPENNSRSLPNPGSVTPEMLNELIRQKPANIGVALRDWVAAGNVPAGKN
jgi:flagellar M-ring protein FliF